VAFTILIAMLYLVMQQPFYVWVEHCSTHLIASIYTWQAFMTTFSTPRLYTMTVADSLIFAVNTMLLHASPDSSYNLASVWVPSFILLPALMGICPSEPAP